MTKTEREDKIRALKLQIDEYQRTINELTEEIDRLNREAVCPECGCEIPDDALFCANCGTRIVKRSMIVENSDLCPQCGAHTEPGTKFCIKCGFRLDMNEVLDTGSADGITDPETPEESEDENEIVKEISENLEKGIEDQDLIDTTTEDDERRCPNCGAELDDDSAFCFMCGTKIDQ